MTFHNLEKKSTLYRHETSGIVGLRYDAFSVNSENRMEEQQDQLSEKTAHECKHWRLTETTSWLQIIIWLMTEGLVARPDNNKELLVQMRTSSTI